MSANIVRALDSNYQWTFGSGTSNYIGGIPQVRQNIQTRLNTFAGECFFATNVGIAWFTYMSTPGLQNQLALNLAITTTIANTLDVISVNQVYINVNSAMRTINVQYNVETVYGPIANTELIAINLLLIQTESGLNLTTESGVPLEEEQNV